jgi:hypothetical protein
MPSRREFLGATVAGVALMAGCLGRESHIARCASYGQGSGSRHLKQLAPIKGDEQVALGIVVSTDAVREDRFHAVDVRDGDARLLASIPLEANRDMNRLTQADFPVLSSDGGELYAVTLGPPPVHADVTASLVSPDDEEIATAAIRFNCYAVDGSLP